RIQFEPGATSAVVTGQLGAHGLSGWIVRARARQTLSAKLTFSNGVATMGISGADGVVLQVDQDRATRFSGVLPTTQDYYINVIGDNESAKYSLAVSIQ